MIKGIHHVSLKCEDKERFGRACRFYTEVLGLKVKRSWDAGVMLDTGSGLIEIFSNGPGTEEIGAVRHFALAADNTDEVIRKVRDAGYEVFVEPKDIVIHSEPPLPARIAFFRGPLNEEVEIFQEYGSGAEN